MLFTVLLSEVQGGVFFRHRVSYRDRFQEVAKLMLTACHVNLNGALAGIFVTSCLAKNRHRYSFPKRQPLKIVINSSPTYTLARQ